MLDRKKIVILSFVAFVVLSFITSLAKEKPSSGNVLDSRTEKTISPTLVYTPSITPLPAVSADLQVGDYYAVEKVIDGDTISVTKDGLKQTIRLIGINTPESVDPRRPVECFGLEASQKAKELLVGRSVRLEPDPTQGERDKYNRLLRFVFRDDGLFYNIYMVQEGYAHEYTYDTPYKYQLDFKNAQRIAQEGKKGLWADSACPDTVKGETDKLEDKDCKDFVTQQEAQDFFISQGGPAKDPHKLNADGDGEVCESLP